MTFISYPDIIAVSPGRKYRLEIVGGKATDRDFFRDQWWGRRITIALEDGTTVDEVAPAQERVISEIEKGWILSQLRRATRELAARGETDPDGAPWDYCFFRRWSLVLNSSSLA